MTPIPQVRNLFGPLPAPGQEEVFDTLLTGAGFRLERILSTGQITPPDQWYDQAQPEWILLLSGSAGLRFDGVAEELTLQPGDCLNIPAHCRHRVEFTDPDQPTLWLALHYAPESA